MLKEVTNAETQNQLARQENITANLTQELITTRQDVHEEIWEKCSAGWRYFQGSYYYFSTERKTWAGSRDACVNMGGHLVIVETREEQYFLQTQKPKPFCWIGLTDSAKEGEWRWVDNTPLSSSITFWAGGQPDNKDGSRGQDCTGLYTTRNGRWLLWDDRYCGNKDIYICEVKDSK
ncbi:C-type lectin domain family 4 member E-like [Engraulis encrasicolus]|uniref:C-type lectin domain family 4 member E-like n=1 Tax=Engraulis encrasicolus TaxID=184585 RepID=UPI002FD2EBD8